MALGYWFLCRWSDPLTPGYLSVKTDVLCMILLYEYGGVYFDFDVMFVRDLAPLFNLELFYRWSTMPWANTAVAHIQQHSTMLRRLIHCLCTEGQCSSQSFLPYSHIVPCLLKAGIPMDESGITVLPSAFFDPVWIPVDTGKGRFMQFYDPCFGDFCNIDNFYPGVFAYHSHWHAGSLANDSVCLKFMRHFKEIIKSD